MILKFFLIFLIMSNRATQLETLPNSILFKSTRRIKNNQRPGLYSEPTKVEEAKHVTFDESRKHPERLGSSANSSVNKGPSDTVLFFGVIGYLSFFGFFMYSIFYIAYHFLEYLALYHNKV